MVDDLPVAKTSKFKESEEMSEGVSSEDDFDVSTPKTESDRDFAVTTAAATDGGPTVETEIDIETIASSMPPKDEQTARIAAMMGGGEEIDV